LEVLNNYQRKKLDENNDEEFYSEPKFVYHLDSNFRHYLSNVYKKEISDYSTVLDLMSSWDSYLPKEKKYKKVIGHGLNKQELEKNKIFDTYWIQNFNLNQKIPLDNESVDYCLMVAAWQYLQYPENLTREISRILSRLLPGLVIKRWMLTSAIGFLTSLLGLSIWTNLSPLYWFTEIFFGLLTGLTKILPVSVLGPLIFVIGIF